MDKDVALKILDILTVVVQGLKTPETRTIKSTDEDTEVLEVPRDFDQEADDAMALLNHLKQQENEDE